MSKDQGKGGSNSGPQDEDFMVCIMKLISSQGISVKDKMEIVQQAVAKCPKISVASMGVQIPSLLDSGSKVSLIRHSYFKEHLLPKIGMPMGEKSEAHNLFNLTAANDGQLPTRKFIKWDVNFMGLKVPNVGFLVIDEPNKVLEKKTHTKLSGIISWNLMWLVFEVFKNKYGEESFNSFQCPVGVNPLLFPHLCLYYYAEVAKDHDYGVQSVYHQTDKKDKSPKKMAELSKNKAEPSFMGTDGLIGQVTIGTKQQPICIPSNSTITIPGCTSKLLSRITSLVEQAEHHILPLGIVINRGMATSEARSIPVILINTNRYIAAQLFDAECDEIEYRASISWDDNNILVGFQPVPPQLINTSSCQVEAGPIELDSPEIERPEFGPRPNTNSAEFDFEKELDCLPFQLNIGKEANLMQNQQSQFTNLVYNNKEVFSLHDEDLGFCDLIKHTIPTTTEKPVYLPHCTIPRQLQGEVQKCLDTWLYQGIIRPSKSLYASQVVIVHKKSGEICLCIDYQKLNFIMVRDTFLLSRIDEALQAVHSSNWFTSFDLTQGYLQLAMEDGNIQKTVFRASSSGLYEFTHMPFGLSNAGSSFFHLMEQCLGDQQFVTLLLYLDDICIFASSIEEMLDHIDLVFSRLKEFHIKIKPKKCHFFDTGVLFLCHVLSSKGISAAPKKVDKVQDWPIPTNAKEVHSFLGLASYYQRFIPKFSKIVQCLHELVGPTSNKHKKLRGQMKGKLAASPELCKPKEFQWMPKHQRAFDALKEALVTAPVLGYPDFSREFVLETDASLQGLGAVLSQQDDSWKLCVIAYASRSLCPLERSMHNYSSAKLELLALKWAVTEKFHDYLVGSKFHVYTDNSPLAYVRESKLGASQIQWLNELALFDFTIHYRTGRSNRAANALSRHPHTDEEINQERDSDCNEVKVISYSLVCKVVDKILSTTKVPDDLKAKAQSISCAIEPIMEEEDAEEIKGMLNSVSVLNQVTL